MSDTEHELYMLKQQIERACGETRDVERKLDVATNEINSRIDELTDSITWLKDRLDGNDLI